MTAYMGPIMCDVNGLALTPEEKEFLQHPLIGGVIFFARNYESPSQIKALSQSIREACGEKPMLLAVDQEGGRVQRFRAGFSRLPHMEQLGKLYDQAPKEAVRLTEACGFIMASEVLAVGVDLSFAPVLDLSTGINPAINGRAFHHDANLIVLLATAFVKGMRKAGMAAVGKHFPGHGSVLVDSHLDLPVDKRTLQEIAETDMVPFQRMIAHGLEGIMAAHIHFSAVDKTAVGFSSFWLQEVLRSQLKFTGMIFSDDLCMEGAKIAGDFPERVIAALEAGCDMALVCNNPDKVKKTLDGLPNEYKMIAPEKYKTLQGKVLQRPKVLEDSLVWREQQAVFTELTAQLNT